jgi:hypothetical protein
VKPIICPARSSPAQAVDESAAYIVVLEESRVPGLEQLLRDFKEKTLQESIYLEIQRDVDVRFL